MRELAIESHQDYKNMVEALDVQIELKHPNLMTI